MRGITHLVGDVAAAEEGSSGRIKEYIPRYARVGTPDEANLRGRVSKTIFRASRATDVWALTLSGKIRKILVHKVSSFKPGVAVEKDL